MSVCVLYSRSALRLQMFEGLACWLLIRIQHGNVGVGLGVVLCLCSQLCSKHSFLSNYLQRFRICLKHHCLQSGTDSFHYSCDQPCLMICRQGGNPEDKFAHCLLCTLMNNHQLKVVGGRWTKSLVEYLSKSI